jgi:hypothetical protein
MQAFKVAGYSSGAVRGANIWLRICAAVCLGMVAGVYRCTCWATTSAK